MCPLLRESEIERGGERDRDLKKERETRREARQKESEGGGREGGWEGDSLDALYDQAYVCIWPQLRMMGSNLMGVHRLPLELNLHSLEDCSPLRHLCPDEG